MSYWDRYNEQNRDSNREGERDGLVTCGRRKDETGKTIYTDTRVCGITGSTVTAWRRV